ncbi:hypothetical protein WJX75_002096 [Coccomyxa subellipsoidea]|uniref:Uncharacterized protein n=1 Tax=Coccomyxa subellipsoidea TaxID=248742 RepID=A0ABR2YDK6_9CHLO
MTINDMQDSMNYQTTLQHPNIRVMKQWSATGPEVVYVSSPGLPCSYIMRANIVAANSRIHIVSDVLLPSDLDLFYGSLLDSGVESGVPSLQILRNALGSQLATRTDILSGPVPALGIGADTRSVMALWEVAKAARGFSATQAAATRKLAVQSSSLGQKLQQLEEKLAHWETSTDSSMVTSFAYAGLEFGASASTFRSVCSLRRRTGKTHLGITFSQHRGGIFVAFKL